MSKRQIDHYLQRLSSLQTERSSIRGYWEELSDHILGHKGRYVVTDRNKAKRNRNILNNTARLAARTLASGMMAGITSPARPWFKLGMSDSQLMEYGPVKEWLHDVELKMREVFSQSNVYNSLHSIYAELGTFGTAPMGVFEDFGDVVRCVPYTAGSYMIDTNGQQEVDTFYREYQMTVGQLVKEYGLENCSRPTRDNWSRGNTASWVDVLHVIEPNDDAGGQKVSNNRGMPYRSRYIEKRRTDADDFLRDSGFVEFPILCPRWDITGDDIYGTNCPGMDALGDVKTLQLHEKRKSQAIDKLVNPPLQAPVSLQNRIQGGGFLPGDIEFVADTAAGIRSIYDFRPDIVALGSDIREDELRIKRAYYEDLFLMLANSDRRQITAREIEERHEEKLLMLGPVLERIHNELLDPLIQRTYNILTKAGVLPQPPQEIGEMEIKVEYVSVLAQAQKLTAVIGLERTAGFAAQLIQAWPEARHKIDASQMIDEYGSAIGVSPRVLRDDDEAAAAVMQEQQQMAAAQMAQMANQGAQTAKAMSETETETPNALTRAMGLA